MATPRNTPYVWVTWVTKLLAGDASCEWATWFRAHNQFDAIRDDGFDLKAWRSKHAALLKDRAGQLRDEGLRVTEENENKFAVTGGNGVTLSGVADIVAIDDDAGTFRVVDCKTGRRRDSDVAQVLIYMLMLPNVRPDLQGLEPVGEVCYSDGLYDVPPRGLDDAFRDRFRDLMQRIGSDVAPPHVPSWQECRYCNIPGSECSARVDEKPDRPVPVDDF